MRHRTLTRAARSVRVAEGLENRALMSVAAPAFAGNYQQAWLQDFRAQSSLSVSAYGPVGPGGTTWMAHKPKNGDWFPFQSPSANNSPFGVDSDGLTIRAQKNGDPNNGFNGYTGGILSSMDDSGNGFYQQYGYFEASMKLPGGANTWPAFWMVSRNGELTKSINVAEVDVMEGYGNWDAGPNKAGDPNHYMAGYHHWNADGSHTGDGHAVDAPGAATGYHTYGVDIEPTGITYYFDRNPVWTAPIYEAAKHPMYVMLDLALGGGNYNNSTGTGYNWNLTPNPSDLKVQYVAVWASPASPNYDPSLSGTVSGVTVGTPGSYSTGNTGSYNALDGANSVFDGDLNTAFNAPTSTNGNGVWVGKDLGSARQITSLSFAPRAGYAGRMVGGVFQVSNTADFSSGVLDLYKVETTPSAGLQSVTVNSGTAYRYVRFLSPDGGWGNVAEISFKALGAPAVPTGLQASAPAGLPVSLTWNGVAGATGYNVYRGTTPGGENATPIAAALTGTGFVDTTVASGTTYYYTVAAVNSLGVGGASGEVSATPSGGNLTVPLTGTTIGTTGSWQTGNTGVYTAGDGASAAFDGSLDTYFDAPGSTNGNGAWVGQDFGSAKAVTEITYAPRYGWAGRMVGGKVQASNTADFSSGVVDLYTITDTPGFARHTVSVVPTGAYRYVRYLSPDGGYGNISELSFRGFSPTTTPTPAGSAPAAPTRLYARPRSAKQITLYWTDNADDETGYVIEREVDEGVWQTLATLGADATTYTNGGLTPGTGYYYRVRAINAYGSSDYSNVAGLFTRPEGSSVSLDLPTPAIAWRPLGMLTGVATGPDDLLA